MVEQVKTAVVPVEPTREMLNAAIDVDAFKLGDISPLGFRISPQMLFAQCWKAMLAAAPEALANRDAQGGEPVAWRCGGEVWLLKRSNAFPFVPAKRQRLTPDTLRSIADRNGSAIERVAVWLMEGAKVSTDFCTYEMEAVSHATNTKEGEV